MAVRLGYGFVEQPKGLPDGASKPVGTTDRRSASPSKPDSTSVGANRPSLVTRERFIKQPRAMSTTVFYTKLRKST